MRNLKRKSLTKFQKILLALSFIFLMLSIILNVILYSVTRNINSIRKEIPQVSVPIVTPSSVPTLTATPSGKVEGKSTTTSKQSAILYLVNEKRKVRGLRTLAYSAKITNGAQRRATALSNSGQWSHDGLNQAVTRAGLVGTYSENLAQGYGGDPASIVNAWEASPIHAKFMFNPACSIGGIGIYGNIVVLWMGVCG